MGLFKKLLGLESSDSADKAFPARATRVKVTPLHRLAVHIGNDVKPLEIANVSVDGLAVFHLQRPEFVEGAEVSGHMLIESQDFAISARIRHVTEVLAGLEFLNADVALRRAVEKYLSVEILALNLRPIASSYLKPDPRGEAMWFTDGKKSEIYCVRDKDGLISFHLGFLGNYVEFERGGRLRAGTVLDSEPREARYKGSDLIEMSRHPSHEIIKLARVFAQNAERAPNDLRAEIDAKLSQST